MFLNPLACVGRMCKMKYQWATRRQNLLFHGLVAHAGAVDVVYAQKAAPASYPGHGGLAARLDPRDHGRKST